MQCLFFQPGGRHAQSNARWSRQAMAPCQYRPGPGHLHHAANASL